MKRGGIRRLREWLFVTLVSSAVLLAIYQFPYTYVIDAASSDADLTLDHFNAVEQSGDLKFRWSGADSVISFPGVVQNQKYQLRLRLAAGPRPDTAPSPQITLTAKEIPFQTFDAPPDWATSRFTLDPGLVGQASDLQISIDVPTFRPSDYFPENEDSRELGVMFSRAVFLPVGRPVGLVALPSWSSLVSWLVASWLAFALIWHFRFGRARRIRWALLLVSQTVLASGLALERVWTLGLIWYLCLGLATALAVLKLGPLVIALLPPANGVEESRVERSFSFEFLHTLGIRNSRVRHWVEAVLIGAMIAYYFFMFLLPLRDGRFWDLQVYYTTSRLILQGADSDDPDLFGQAAPNLVSKKGNVAVLTYPPSGALLISPLALLPLNEVKWWWLLLRFGCLVGAGVVSTLALRKSVPQTPSPVWLALLFTTSQSVYDSLYWGNIDAFFPLLFGLALWGWTNRQAAATAAGIVLPTLSKITPGLYLAYFLLKRAWSEAVASVALGGGFFLLTLAVFGPQTWLDYVSQQLPANSLPEWAPSEQGLVQLLRRLNSLSEPFVDRRGQPPGVEIRLLELGITIGLLGLTLWWFRRYSSADTLHAQLEFGTVSALMLLIVPRMWIHDLMWLIVPSYLVVALVVARRLPRSAQMAIASLLGLGWLLSQVIITMVRLTNWPEVLMSMGWYGTFLIYVCLLYALSKTARSTVAPVMRPLTRLVPDGNAC